MSFHTAPQFHATISHHTLFFTTPFCTTSHSLVHSGHRHSTSYNVPFHITTYNKYISSIVFKSALKTHLFSCVCVKRVQIALCITLLSSTPHVFTSHNIPSHNAKRFYITPPFTSHHSTPPHTILHHTTIAQHSTSHYYIPMSHATSRTLCWNTSHLGPPYFQYLRSHYTAVCLGTTISRHHISKHMFHITQPQSTSRAIPHPQLLHTTPTSFSNTAYFTPHHFPHPITPPHLDFTSHHHVWHHNTLHHFPHLTSQSHSTLYMPRSSSLQFHTTAFHFTS